jgi:hypothetical protein
MNIYNSPYEFDQFSRNLFIMFLEKYLNSKRENDSKIDDIYKSELQSDLSLEKKLICLDYFRQKSKDSSDEYNKFIAILQTIGFSAKNSKNFPKFLIDKDSQYIIDICKKKGYIQHLDGLESYADIDYSVIYLDKLLNFFSTYLNVSSDGKNKNLYDKLFNKTVSFSNLFTDYNKKLLLNVDDNISTIIRGFNSSQITLSMDNYVCSIIESININSNKIIPKNNEYILDEKEKQNEKMQIYHKRFYQLDPKNELNFIDIFEYFSYCKKILDTNSLQFINKKIKSKERYNFDIFQICDESLINKYEKIYKKYKKTRKILKKSKKSKKNECYYKVFTEIIPSQIERNILEYLSLLNNNFEEFLIYGTLIRYHKFFKLNYFKDEVEYDVHNNLFYMLTNIQSNMNENNVHIYQFMIKNILIFFNTPVENVSFIQKIYKYDIQMKSFNVSCSLFALFKSLISKIFDLKVINIDKELLNMYVTFQKSYYKHIQLFSTKKKTNRKLLMITDLTKDLSKDVQKFLLSSGLLKSLPSDKKIISEWIEILISMYERHSKEKKTIKKDKCVKKLQSFKNKTIVIESHLYDLIYSNTKLEKNNDNVVEETITKETIIDKTSFKYLYEIKEARDSLQQLINQLELMDEDASSYISQLEKLDAEIESLSVNHEYLEETCDEDIAAGSCVELGKKLVRYRALLEEYKKNQNVNFDKIEEMESTIDNCIQKMEYNRNMMPTLDPKTGKIQGSKTVTYLPYEEYEYKYIPLTEEGKELKKLLDEQDKKSSKNDKILYQENKFKVLLKQSHGVVSNLIYKLNNFFEDSNSININIFAKKVVYDIFNEYWFNKRYCIKNKLEMYFRMYVNNGNKEFNKGYSQIVLDLMKLLSLIQYIILNQDKLDFKKLLSTSHITIDKKLHTAPIFLGKTVKILDGDNIDKTGIVFKETETHVIIKNDEENIFIEECKTNIKQIIINTDLIRKLIKPIVGHYKGFTCMIIGVAKKDTFIISLDTYGGRPDKILPGLTVFYAKREEFVILPENLQFSKDSDTIREFKHSELTFKPKSNDLYTYVRCLYDLFSLSTNYLMKYKSTQTHDERFNFLYGIALILYNKNKITNSKYFFSYNKSKNKLINYEQDLRNCSKFNKADIMKTIFKTRKQLEKKKFEYDQVLIFEEQDAWDNSQFKTSPLNNNTEFLVFNNTSSEYIQTNSVKEKQKKRKKIKIKMDVKKETKKSIQKLDAIFESFDNI